MEISGKLSGVGRLTGSLAGVGSLNGSMTVPDRVPPPTYEGAYEITPGPEEIVLNTGGLVMSQAVTIHPVPSNYGLITWDGSTLTVS